MTADSKNVDTDEQLKLAVVAVLEGELAAANKQEGPNVKEIRKKVLMSLQLDDSEKAVKKQFKNVVQLLQDEGIVSISEDGIVSMKKKSEKRKSKDEKKGKKKKRKKEDKHENIVDNKGSPDGASDGETPQHKDEDQQQVDEDVAAAETGKNKPCKGNPQGVTRLFLGNLPFAVDEASLESFLPKQVTHIKWITDKETGKFYGSAFVEMDNSLSAAKAVAMAGEQLMGRSVKINFAPSRPGDVWPPSKKVISGGSTVTTGGQAGGTGIKALGEKPANCLKLFIGNLSYEIDDDGITKFFDNVGAEVKAVRWLHHKESGDFKGCGFIEFWNTEACEKAATMNGKNLLGRPIRIDWAE